MIVIVGAIDRSSRYSIDRRQPWEMSGAPLRIPNRELKRAVTGHIVIMGKGVFESVNKRPLPGCVNILVSTTWPDDQRLFVKRSFEDALRHAKEIANGRNIVILGGARLWRKTLPLADEVHITEVKRDFPPKEGEVAKRFSEFSELGNLFGFKEITRKRESDTGAGITCEIVTYKKRKKEK